MALSRNYRHGYNSKDNSLSQEGFKLPSFTAKRTEPHTFVPEGFDPTDVDALNKLFDTLQARDVDTRDALERFILDWQELETVLYECASTAYIDMTVDTTRPHYEERYLQVVETMLPVEEQRSFDLKKKLLASPAVGELGDDYAMLLRNVKSDVGIFREENVPLFTEARKLEQEYNK